jgi:hypothetical protein
MFPASKQLDTLYSQWIYRRIQDFRELDLEESSLLALSELPEKDIRDYLQISFHTICVESAMEANFSKRAINNLNIHLLTLFQDRSADLQKLINVIKYGHREAHGTRSAQTYSH